MNKFVKNIISGLILASIAAISTQDINASIRKKLEKRLEGRRPKIAKRIPKHLILGKRGVDLTQNDIKDEIQKFLQLLETIKPTKTKALGYKELNLNNSKMWVQISKDTYDINDIPVMGSLGVPSNIEQEKLEDTYLKITSFRIENSESQDFTVLNMSVKSKNNWFKKPVYLSNYRKFNLLELNKDGIYTLNKTLWGGNKKNIILGLLTVLLAGQAINSLPEKTQEIDPKDQYDFNPDTQCDINGGPTSTELVAITQEIDPKDLIKDDLIKEEISNKELSQDDLMLQKYLQNFKQKPEQKEILAIDTNDIQMPVTQATSYCQKELTNLPSDTLTNMCIDGLVDKSDVCLDPNGITVINSKDSIKQCIGLFKELNRTEKSDICGDFASDKIKEKTDTVISKLKNLFNGGF